ncbi:MAG: hypothetical protein EOL95_07240 [Bacteroidia bacterium]|nr:hypothetical protein [Bacteroidia bacterium]
MEDHELLSKWYYAQPHNCYIEKRNAITTACGVNVFTFYNWLAGKSRLSILEKREIERIAGKKIFDANTTER